MGEQVAWARVTAAALLVPLGPRWAHTLGVVGRAQSLVELLPATDGEVLVAVAYLHDIGYAPRLVRTGFHPLDGARFLRSLGRGCLACLVAHHSGARAEADERGLSEELSVFPEERSLVAEALTYCDLSMSPDGALTSPAVRLSEVVARYGEAHPVGRAVGRSRDELLARVRRFRGGGDVIAG